MVLVMTVLLALLLAAPAQAASDADLFNDQALHDVWIHINTRDWQMLVANYDENTYYPCDFEWEGLKAYNAAVRVRGTGTRSATKPGFRVDFDRYTTGGRFLGLSSVVLDNLGQDPSMIREPVAMNLFRRMGIPAPREAFVRVFVGATRELMGLYTIVEDVNEQFLARQFGESGGYLYEYKWVSPYYLQDLGPELEPYAQRFEPKTHRVESPFNLYAPIRTLIQAIADAPVPDLENALAPHLDVRLFLKQVAIENFISEWDGILGYDGFNNVYLYRYEGRTLSQFIPWDKDVTFLTVGMPPWHKVDENVLMWKAWQVPELRGYFLQTLLECAGLADARQPGEPDGPGWLEHDVARYDALIHLSALADRRKPYSNEQFETSVADLEQFVHDRAALVRLFVSQTPRD